MKNDLSKKLEEMITKLDWDHNCCFNVNTYRFCGDLDCDDCPFGSNKNLKKALEGLKNVK